MKTDKNKKTKKKFDLKKMEVAKLKNMHSIIGGGNDGVIDGTGAQKARSTGNC